MDTTKDWMLTLRKRIKHNDLLPWFLEDHGTLPASYLKSCEKFFKSLKQQAPSSKHQAVDMKEIIGYKIVNKGEI